MEAESHMAHDTGCFALRCKIPQTKLVIPLVVGIGYRVQEEIVDLIGSEALQTRAQLAFGRLGGGRNLRVYLGQGKGIARMPAHERFARGFFGSHVHVRSIKIGKPLKDMTLSEMDELWNEAKKSEK